MLALLWCARQCVARSSQGLSTGGWPIAATCLPCARICLDWLMDGLLLIVSRFILESLSLLFFNF